MDPNTSFDLLLDRINDFFHDNGYYPKVRISKAFWEQFAHEIADLAKDNISINVVDNLLSRNSFLLDKTDVNGTKIDTLKDLKKQVDTWIHEGKGDWPVRCMAMNADLYIPIQLFSIVPGEAEEEGLDLQEEFWEAPPGEHILVITGD